MAKKKKIRRSVEEVNSSSMADIAFLLLIFFLVTTTILNEKGMNFILPKKKEKEEEVVQQKERNVFKVLLNSDNRLLVRDHGLEIEEVREEAKLFLKNRGHDPELSESPEKAIISFKTDRGTDFKTYLAVLDELQAAYNELRAEHLNLSVDRYLKLDPTEEEDNLLLQHARAEYPPTLSEAEPSNF